MLNTIDTIAKADEQINAHKVFISGFQYLIDQQNQPLTKKDITRIEGLIKERESFIGIIEEHKEKLVN